MPTAKEVYVERIRLKERAQDRPLIELPRGPIYRLIVACPLVVGYNAGMVGRLPFSICWILAVILTAAACDAEGPPVAAKKRSPTRISASITEVAVQDRLNLSPEQRKKVAELAGQRDAKLAEMQALPKRDGTSTWRQQQEITGEFEKQVRSDLSQEQQKQWSSLKQLEFACFSGPAWAALDEEMQAELKLTDSQAAAIDELQKDFCRECERAMQATGQFEQPAGVRLWDTPFMIKVREASVTFDERRDTLLQKVFSRQQYDRWIEIEWQRAAERDGPAVFLEQAVVDYLKFSAGQQREIQAIADETKLQVENEEKERRFYAATKIPRANLGRALAVLTSDQQQLWAGFLGKPYHDRMWRRMSSSPAPPSDP